MGGGREAEGKSSVGWRWRIFLAGGMFCALSMRLVLCSESILFVVYYNDNKAFFLSYLVRGIVLLSIRLLPTPFFLCSYTIDTINDIMILPLGTRTNSRLSCA